MSGSDLNFFADESEVLQIITCLCGPHDQIENKFDDDSSRQKFDRLSTLLCKYLEQPSLLNGSMTSIMAHFCGALLRLSLAIQQSQLITGSNFSSSNISDESVASPRTAQFLLVCESIQLLCRVRGFKHVLKHFPHEVSHLELCVNTIQCQVIRESERWSGRYVLLLWLSVLSSIPFSILTLDSSFLVASVSGSDVGSDIAPEVSDRDKPRLVDTMLNICRSYLSDAGLVRDAAAHCIAALLSRPDMRAEYLHQHVMYARRVLDAWQQQQQQGSLSPEAELKAEDCADKEVDVDNEEECNPDTVDSQVSNSPLHGEIAETITLPEDSGFSALTFRAIGTLYSVVQMLKRSDRARTLPLADALANLAASVPASALAGQTTVRQLLTKLCGKTCLVVLPSRQVAWAYARGKRSLTDNLSKLQGSAAPEGDSATSHVATDGDNVGNKPYSGANMDEEAATDDSIEQVELVEELIDTLLTRLADGDTVVRWSAAKSLGRLALRLPRAHAVDVIEHILLLFDDDVDSDSSWHGGCLALAELARRNLIPPDILASRVLAIIKRAIVFDVQRGHNSVGSNVRDAGCYLCWSLGHSYDPLVLAPHVVELGCHNLITAVFDREVNCRRAASAAFQENIGRQGALSFPNGLEIIAVADYQSLGNRTVAYLEIAPSVAQFGADLFLAFQYHLRYVKLVHWDEEIRVLASKSLARLVSVNRAKSIELLPELVRDSFSDNLYKRHGCVLGCAELIYALYVSDAEGEVLTDALVAEVVGIVPQLQTLRMYRGRGTEMMRAASCHLVRMIALSHLTVSPKMQVTLLEALNENLRQPHKKVQQAARAALRQYLFTYFGTNLAATPSDKLVKETVALYTKGLLTDENVAVTRGYAQALGALPFRLSFLPTGSFTAVLSPLARVLSADPKNLSITLTDSAAAGPEPSATTVLPMPSPEAGSALIPAPVSKAPMTPAAAAALYMKQKAARAAAPKATSTRLSTGSASSSNPSSSSTFSCQQDVETRVFAVEALVELLEATEGAWVVGERAEDLGVINSVLTMLLHACDDYATDNRGDVGSWVRMAAMKAIERVLYFAWRNIEFKSIDSCVESDSVASRSTDSMTESGKKPVLTSFGLGFLTDSANDSVPAAATVCVEFPRLSGGFLEANRDNAHSMAGAFLDTSADDALLLRRKFIDVSKNSTNRVVGDDKLHAAVGACVRVIVKQLGEKLDAVRAVAGGVLMRLATIAPDMTHAFPSLRLLRSTCVTFISKHLNGTASVDWSDPDTAYPFLSDLYLRSLDYDMPADDTSAEMRALRDSILAGLVISVGCINENIAKASRQSFVALCQQLHRVDMNDSNRHGNSLFGGGVCCCLLDLFKHFPATDRVTLPLLKSLNSLLHHGLVLHDEANMVSDLSPCPFDSLFQVVRAQYNATQDVGKVKLCADVFALYLRSSVEIRRRGALRALLVMLGHRLPNARKHAAESLYLHLLSDPFAVSRSVENNTEGVGSSAVMQLSLCSFFVDPALYEEVLSLLVATVWEEDAVTARIVRLRICVLLGVDLQISQSSVDESTSVAQKKGESTRPDELESYSYLVREEGR